MMRQMLLACAVLAAAAAASDSIVVHPQNVAFWSGFAEYNIGHSPVYTHWDGYVTWAFYPDIDNARDRGWAKFDLAPVPDTQAIVSATVLFYMDFQTSSKPLNLRVMTTDPVAAEAQVIYTEAGSGTLAGSLASTDTGWNRVELNSAGIAALQSRLAQDWASLGWDYPGTEYAILEAHGRQHPNRPSIVLRFSQTGVREMANGECRLPNGPTVVRGRLNLQSSIFNLQSAELMDAAGRRVMKLVAGENDVSRLAPGVYFLREATGAWRATTTRLTIIR